MPFSRLTALAGLLLLAAACAKTQGEHQRRQAVPDAAAAPGRPHARATSRPAAAALASAASSLPGGGADFSAQAQRIYRLTTCGDGAAAPADVLPAGVPAKLVAAHCASMRAYRKRHARQYLEVARPFLAALRPPDLPRTAVYPFGGGDLLFALSTFPDATEITTISLERSGDPRGVDVAPTEEKLREGLADVLWMYMRLASVDYNFTTHMWAMQSRMLPIQVALALAALWTHGYVPVSLRYFHVAPDGTLRYVTHAEIARSDAEARAAPVVKKKRPRRPGRRGKLKVRPRPVPEVFANMELTYLPIGAKPGASPRTYRHIAANLDDKHLAASPGLLKHLAAKGPVAAMTKAASYLLWLDGFSRIRDYLLSHMVWMVSDSTGILPRHARAAGFVQLTYGRFKRALLGTKNSHNKEMGDLWRSQPCRELPFFYGYPDFDNRSAHLLITRRGEKL